LVQAEQVRRRRIEPPSSATRESRTRVSVLRQYGQCISGLLVGRDLWISGGFMWITSVGL
jgi:hypothetical protein